MNDEIDKMSEEELEEEMQRILAEVESNPESVNWEPPKEMHDKVLNEIRKREDKKAREQLSEEDKELLQYGMIYKSQLKRRKYWVLAAVLVMVFAVGMTSMGGPEKLVQRMTRVLSGREQDVVNTDDGNIIEAENLSEEQAFEEIAEKFGVYPVRLDYLPEGVVFEKMEIWEEIQGAQLFYVNENKLVIELRIQANNRTGSMGLDIEDVVQETYIMQNGSIDIEVKNYFVEETREQRWSVAFTYQDINYYLIIHDMNQEQVESIITNIVMK